MSTQANELREGFRKILTPNPPRDAEEHGGVVKWKATLTSDGLNYTLDQLCSLVQSYVLENIIGKDEAYDVDDEYYYMKRVRDVFKASQREKLKEWSK